MIKGIRIGTIALAISASLALTPVKAIASPTWTVTAKYGEVDEVHKTPHKGIDFALPMNTPVKSFTEGKVTQILDEGNKSFGKSVRISSGDRVIIYGHLSKILVKAGDTVRFGQVIGLSGSTGFSTGPHLHVQVNIAGKAVDPRATIGGAMLRQILTGGK